MACVLRRYDSGTHCISSATAVVQPLSISLILHELEEPVRVRLRVYAADVRLAFRQ
jgi:hypothetical protein